MTADTGRPLTALIVDDNPMDRTLAGGLIQKLGPWQTVFAGNGVEALEVLRDRKPDLVLTDMLMPEMDGLELVRAIREQHPGIPVILMTAHGSEDTALQALQAGAASYVPKKSLARDLADTIDSVVMEAQTKQQQQRIVDALAQLETSFVLENDTSLIQPLVGYLEDTIQRVQLVDPSGMILLGVALHEAVTNAIFHGNLELSSAVKEQDEAEYYRLADERRGSEPYRDRRVHVTVRLTREGATFVVRDEGRGFDPATLPDPTDPANMERVHGRGLLLIQTFMDRVSHNAVGNEITMVKLRK